MNTLDLLSEIINAEDFAIGAQNMYNYFSDEASTSNTQSPTNDTPNIDEPTVDSSPEDGQVTEKKSDLEESNKKANNAAAEQAAIDEAENEKSKSNSPDEVKASTNDEKKRNRLG